MYMYVQILTHEKYYTYLVVQLRFCPDSLILKANAVKKRK